MAYVSLVDVVRKSSDIDFVVFMIMLASFLHKVCPSHLCVFVSGEAFIRGACFFSPAQVEHVPTRLFYKKEVIRSSGEQTVVVSNIVGHCAVLSYKEYCTSRLTEIPENDVFVCESKYDYADKVIKKFNKPLKVHNTWLFHPQ